MNYGIIPAVFLVAFTSARGDDTLSKALEKWKAHKSVEFNVTVLANAKGSEKIRGRCRFEGERACMELYFEMRGTNTLIVDDGRHVWTEESFTRVSGRKTVTKTPKVFFERERESIQGLVLTLPGALNPKKVMKILMESYDIEETGPSEWRDTPVLRFDGTIRKEAVPPRDDGGILDLVAKVRIFIERDTLRLKGVELFNERPDQALHVLTYSNYKTDLEFTKGTFAYRPPHGVKVIDTGEEMKKNFLLPPDSKKPAVVLSASSGFHEIPPGNRLEIILNRDGSVQALDRNHKGTGALRSLFRHARDVCSTTTSGAANVDVAVFTASSVPLSYLARLLCIGGEEDIRIYRYHIAVRNKKTKEEGFLSFHLPSDPGEGLVRIILECGGEGPVYMLGDSEKSGAKAFSNLADLEKALEAKGPGVGVRLELGSVPMKGKVPSKVKVKHLIELITLLVERGVELTS